jgi:hypothetical protein
MAIRLRDRHSDTIPNSSSNSAWARAWPGGRGELTLAGTFFLQFIVSPRASRQPFRYNSVKDPSSKQVEVFWRELAREASKKTPEKRLWEVTGEKKGRDGTPQVVPGGQLSVHSQEAVVGSQ